MSDNLIRTAEALDALPVGSVVRGHYETRDPLYPRAATARTMDLFVTRSTLIAERYECGKGDRALAYFGGGFEVLYRPDAPAPRPVTATSIEGES